MCVCVCVCFRYPEGYDGCEQCGESAFSSAGAAACTPCGDADASGLGATDEEVDQCRLVLLTNTDAVYVAGWLLTVWTTGTPFTSCLQRLPSRAATNATDALRTHARTHDLTWFRTSLVGWLVGWLVGGLVGWGGWLPGCCWLAGRYGALGAIGALFLVAATLVVACVLVQRNKTLEVDADGLDADQRVMVLGATGWLG